MCGISNNDPMWTKDEKRKSTQDLRTEGVGERVAGRRKFDQIIDGITDEVRAKIITMNQ